MRKRYRSLESTTDVALILVVHEKPGVRSAIGGVNIPGVPDSVARPVGRLRSKLMFLPIISYADGYGFTYGGRVSTVDLLGIDERLSVPLTWGGTRRAALEFERLFKTGPLTRIASSLAIWNRENPALRDPRSARRGQGPRRAGVRRRLPRRHRRQQRTISFGTLDDDLWTFGTSAGIDTRLDPAFPGNAVLTTVGWTGMHFRTISDPVNRFSADARGYLRAFRQIVLAGRAAYTGADASLPPYERLLLGGSSSVRGFRTGSFDGDRTFVTSAEVRVPITSVLSGAKLGLTVFYDAGKAWDFGSRMEDAQWHRGAGAGVFLIASIVRINLDIARGLRRATRTCTCRRGLRSDRRRVPRPRAKFQRTPNAQLPSQLSIAGLNWELGVVGIWTLALDLALLTQTYSSSRTTHSPAVPPAGACTTGTSTRRS